MSFKYFLQGFLLVVTFGNSSIIDRTSLKNNRNLSDYWLKSGDYVAKSFRAETADK